MDGKLIVSLDIGTTKICVLVGKKDEHGKLEILGRGIVESEGVLRGVVSNIEKTINGIKDAIIEAEKSANVDIGTVNVGIAGQHIKSLQHRGMHTRDNVNDEISKEDIDLLINNMHKLVLPPGDRIIHVIPQEFIVDQEQGIVDPIGMSGITLEANFHIITGQMTAIKNIKRCVERSNLTMDTLALEPIASSESVLNKEEMMAGVALVDIGGGTTDLAIFYDGIIRHTAVVPLGGNSITRDIKEGCSVLHNYAEKLKVRFGCAMPNLIKESRVISIPTLRGKSHKEISERNLSRIINARLSEIMDMIYFEIRKSGYENKLLGGVVLTGGGSMLKGIVEMVEFHTGLTARIGNPTEHLSHGYSKEMMSPKYATAIGLILRKMNESTEGVLKEEQAVEVAEQGDSWFERIFKGAKNWIENEPDANL